LWDPDGSRKTLRDVNAVAAITSAPARNPSAKDAGAKLEISRTPEIGLAKQRSANTWKIDLRSLVGNSVASSLSHC
jgi:hypothetical protein